VASKTDSGIACRHQTACGFIEVAGNRLRRAESEIQTLGVIEEAHPALVVRTVVLENVRLASLSQSKGPKDRFGDGAVAVRYGIRAGVPVTGNFVGIGPCLKCKPRMRAQDVAVCGGLQGMAHRSRPLLGLSDVTFDTHSGAQIMGARCGLIRGRERLLGLILTVQREASYGVEEENTNREKRRAKDYP
jgi:hypothetical protein